MTTWGRLSLIALVLVPLGCRPAAPLDGPRLVLVLVVDQMRADYLARFGNRMTGGLARLVQNGAVFTNAHHDYAATETAPGHASLVTGLYPSQHGLVRNSWYDRTLRRRVYSVEDETAPILGMPEAGGRSPVNLMTNTLGDWLKRTSPRSRVFSAAMKDRAAITMGGKGPDGVYWYDRSTGRFVTSVYYASEYPEWVARFHAEDPAAAYQGKSWERLFPEETYTASREDDFPPEGDGTSATFPHRVGSIEETGGWARFSRVLRRSPFADKLTFRFVLELIINEQLGADEVSDLLFFGISPPDYVGHSYGPYSQEIEDYYLRLDRRLDTLFTFLDQRLGRPNYAVVLTADHGVLPMPEELARRGVDAARVERRRLVTLAQAALESDPELFPAEAAPQVHVIGGLVVEFPDRLSESQQATARSRIATALRQSPAVMEAYTYEELLTGSDDGRPYIDAFRRSFSPNRAADVVWLPREHVLITDIPTETSHGTPHPHDTHVPLIFAGPGITPGTHGQPVRIVDVAPTLAAILGLAPRAGLDGQPLEVGRSR